MHIAYIHYLVDDDTGRHHVRQFVEGARALGHRLDVHAMNMAPRPQRADQEPGTTPFVSRARATLKKHLGRYLHEPKELLWNPLYIRQELSLLRAARPDVLLVRDQALTASCVPVARRLGLPLVLEMNAPASEGHLYMDEYAHLPWIAGWMQRVKIRRADAVTVVSSTLKALLMGIYGEPEDKFFVAPNGADLDQFRPDAPPDAEFGWREEGGVVIGFVGSFRKWHGADLMGRVLREVGAQRPQVRFLLVGDGPEAPRVRHWAGPLGDRVIFTGTVGHGRVPALVARMDIGILPETLFYASPLKLIEWMAAGKAVVAPRYASVQDVVDDDVHGLLFPPGDGEALVRAILRLVDDGSLRRRLAAAAAARAHASLSWVDNARRVVGACEAAVSRRAAHGPPKQGV